MAEERNDDTQPPPPPPSPPFNTNPNPPQLDPTSSFSQCRPRVTSSLIPTSTLLPCSNPQPQLAPQVPRPTVQWFPLQNLPNPRPTTIFSASSSSSRPLPGVTLTLGPQIPAGTDPFSPTHPIPGPTPSASPTLQRVVRPRLDPQTITNTMQWAPLVADPRNWDPPNANPFLTGPSSTFTFGSTSSSTSVRLPRLSMPYMDPQIYRVPGLTQSTDLVVDPRVVLSNYYLGEFAARDEARLSQIERLLEDRVRDVDATNQTIDSLYRS